jgi:CBS domain-containing protein
MSSGGTGAYAERLSDIEDIAVLKSVREREQRRLLGSMPHRPAAETAEALNGLHDALIARSIALAEKQMARMGRGAPPVPYAYLLFGSGGRREMTFTSDQDSGIVYADVPSESGNRANAEYFGELSRIVVQLLVQLGYPPCEGNVIASHPPWRRSLSSWEERVDGWFAEPNWENVRYLLIAADGRVVAGDPALLGKLTDRYYFDVLDTPVIARRMLENTLRHKVLVGVFGQLLREPYGENAGGLDIKYGAYIPMVNVFRLMAVRAGIRETGTLARIRALKAAGELTPNEADAAVESFNLILKLRLLAAARIEEGRWVGSGKIAKEQLTSDLVLPLKRALKFGKFMQRKLERAIRDRYRSR